MNEDDLDQEDEATSRLCHNGWDQEKLVPAGGGKIEVLLVMDG